MMMDEEGRVLKGEVVVVVAAEDVEFGLELLLLPLVVLVVVVLLFCCVAEEEDFFKMDIDGGSMDVNVGEGLEEGGMMTCFSTIFIGAAVVLMVSLVVLVDDEDGCFCWFWIWITQSPFC